MRNTESSNPPVIVSDLKFTPPSQKEASSGLLGRIDFAVNDLMEIKGFRLREFGGKVRMEMPYQVTDPDRRVSVSFWGLESMREIERQVLKAVRKMGVIS